jgi:hypothetical protein
MRARFPAHRKAQPLPYPKYVETETNNMNTKDMVSGPAERLFDVVSSLIDFGSALDVIARWVRNAGRDARDILGFATWLDDLKMHAMMSARV